MVRRCVAAILLLLSVPVGSALADNPSCSPSMDEGDVALHLPYDALTRKSDPVREEGTDDYQPGPWLALACKEKACRLVRVQLKVETVRPDPPPEDGYCVVYQLLNWDFSPLGEGEHAVMMFLPDPILKEGNIPTWYVSESFAPDYKFVPFYQRTSPVNGSVRIPTPTPENPKRISVLSTRWVTSRECTEQQANQECMRKTVRVQLREGKANQWLTRPWKGSPKTANCMVGYVSVGGDFNRDYLLWVGDLDGDNKPDYLLENDDWDEWGVALHLSSKAGPQQLVAKAGRHWTRMPCD